MRHINRQSQTNLKRLDYIFQKIKNWRKDTIEKIKNFLYCGFNLSLYGNNFEYKNNPTIKIFIKIGINFIILLLLFQVVVVAMLYFHQFLDFYYLVQSFQKPI